MWERTADSVTASRSTRRRPELSSTLATARRGSERATVVAAGSTSPLEGLPADAIKQRVSVLQTLAIEAGDRGDWLTAADHFEEAYVFTPDNMVLAYKAGEAANDQQNKAQEKRQIAPTPRRGGRGAGNTRGCVWRDTHSH